MLLPALNERERHSSARHSQASQDIMMMRTCMELKWMLVCNNASYGYLVSYIPIMPEGITAIGPAPFGGLDMCTACTVAAPT